MMMAGLSLAAAPFITSGFWSKDAIIASVLESGYQYSWAIVCHSNHGVFHDGILYV